MNLIVFAFLLITANGQEADRVEETTIDLCSNGTEESCEAFNTTELSTLPATAEVTSATSKKTTTKKPKTTTAKTVVKKTSVQNGSSPLYPHPECSCDLTRGGCEVNCCCDVDCSDGQRAVFTRCSTVAAAVDSDHCVSPGVLYRNNTDHQTMLTDGGMLCVIRQNSHVTIDYLDVPVVKTVAILKPKLKQLKYYSWKYPQPVVPVFDSDTPYAEGAPVWTSSHTAITHLAFPTAAGYSTQCIGSVLPKYLVDVESSCTVHLENKVDCLRHSDYNFTVISSPRNFNFTAAQECTDDVCLPIHQFICSKTCSEEKIPTPTFNETSKVCINVVRSINYEMYHNGSQGIVEVKAFYTLGNFTVDEGLLIRKRYRVVYKWTGINGEKPLARSGHPGYERGRPIISGKKVGKTVVLNSSEAEWMSLAVAGPAGQCEERHNVMFRVDLRSQCIAKVKGTCKQIQKQIWQHMLGPGGNLSEMVVSAYGDPRVADPEAWVPLLTSDLPSLPSLVTAVDIVVLYTRVGAAVKPQAKIIGVFLQLHSDVSCTPELTEVMVGVSVKFVDKTVAPVTKFAPPPVYEIKLPEDFFYPFLSSGSKMHSAGKSVQIKIALLQWVMGYSVFKLSQSV